MKNALNRNVPDGMLPYQGAEQFKQLKNRKLIPEVLTKNTEKSVESISALFDLIPIHDGMTLSFHHHLRNGDAVLNMVIEEIKKRNLKNMTLAPSSIFPIHEPLVELIKHKNVIKIITNYMNGPVADAISQGYLAQPVIMDTHGGRPRAIESGELKIDVAFIAVPNSDKLGNGNGIYGPNACGSLGYSIADMKYASHKVVITDHISKEINPIEIEAKYIDYIILVKSIGDINGIVSGTTKPTKDPVQLKIAKDTVELIEELGYLKNNMSFQTGAGGTSLAVADELKKKMIQKNIKGSFASGGITSYLVQMHEFGLFKHLYDVQCFDHEAISSLSRNPNHHLMSASKYANPFENKPKVNDLDVVILGATEIDLDFNVNVTTDSNGNIIGGSGGHSDTAYGAKLCIITTNLIKSRTSIIKKHVTTITTPGSTVDCLVTERGIAINPLRVDLIEKLKNSKLNIIPIASLLDKAYQMTGIPNEVKKSNQVIGVLRYRDGSIIDTIYQIEKKPTSYNLEECKTPKAIEQVKLLLENQGLSFEEKVTYTIGYYDENKLIATGSLYMNVIKMIAVDPSYQGENITEMIMTALTQKLQNQGIHKYFLFTTPKNKHIFESFSLSLIVENEDIVLFENDENTISETLKNIKDKLNLTKGQTAAIVMNCNPVTYGHLYLIRVCAEQNDNVIIFLVEENKSIFPFETRLNLLREATKEFTNVHIIPSTQYIISRATFPTYFLKEFNDISKAFMKIDIAIFKQYFMPIFSIDKRYVGEEPLDPTTNAYNETMKQMLKEHLVVIKRLEHFGLVISASQVRKIAKQHEYELLKEIVPDVTYKYLKSLEGMALFDDD